MPEADVVANTELGGTRAEVLEQLGLWRKVLRPIVALGERIAVHVVGHVTSLLRLRAGMLPDASGLENIRIRSTLMGLTAHDTAKLTENVAEFSGLGKFLQLPLRTYSAGMAMRLSFALATSMKPQILIMDEWLSAGDASFRKTAEARMSDFVAKAGIIVLASHSRDLISRVCTRKITLANGEMVDDIQVGHSA